LIKTVCKYQISVGTEERGSIYLLTGILCAIIAAGFIFYIATKSEDDQTIQTQDGGPINGPGLDQVDATGEEEKNKASTPIEEDSIFDEKESKPEFLKAPPNQADEINEQDNQVDKLKDDFTSYLNSLFEDDRFREAYIATEKFDKKEALLDNDDIVAYRTEKLKQIGEALKLRCRSIMNEGSSLLKEGEFNQAKEAFDEVSVVLASLESIDNDTLSPTISGIREQIKKELEGATEAEDLRRQKMRDDDLEMILSSLHSKEIKKDVLEYSFDNVCERFKAVEKKLKTDEYKKYLHELGNGVICASRLLTKLKTVIKTNSLLDDLIIFPGPKDMESGWIVGLMSDGTGLRIKTVSGKRSRIHNVVFSRFCAAKDLINLFKKRFPMDGRALLDLAEAALHFDSAACAENLSSIEKAMNIYNPDTGWVQGSGEDLNFTPLQLESGPWIINLIDEAVDLDATLSERSDELKTRLAEEELSLESFYQSIEPFINTNSRTDFGEGVVLLNEFMRSYPDTVFFWYVRRLAGPPRNFHFITQD